MTPSYEDDIARLPVITAWGQTFPTADGIFAQADSPAALTEHRSRVSVHALTDPKLVVIGEKHDTGYRRLIAERGAVLPMVDALTSGRLPYRFMTPNGDATVELARAMHVEALADGEYRWGAQLIQLEGNNVRRLRCILAGLQVFVIVEGAHSQPVVFGGSRVDLIPFGILRHDEVLDQLT